MDKFEVSPKVNELGIVNEPLPFDREDIECSDEMRIYKAKQLGLPETATWDEVADKGDKVNIAKRAVMWGLPEDSTHEEVLREEEKRGIGLGAVYLLLSGLSLDATREEVEEVERKRAIQEMIILRKVAEDMRVNRAKNITPSDRLE